MHIFIHKYICIFMYIWAQSRPVICTYCNMYVPRARGKGKRGVVYVYVNTCVHIYMYTYLYMYVFLYIYLYVYEYIYMYINIWINMYTEGTWEGVREESPVRTEGRAESLPVMMIYISNEHKRWWCLLERLQEGYFTNLILCIYICKIYRSSLRRWWWCLLRQITNEGC
jgi:hypothetical protein